MEERYGITVEVDYSYIISNNIDPEVYLEAMETIMAEKRILADANQAEFESMQRALLDEGGVIQFIDATDENMLPFGIGFSYVRTASPPIGTYSRANIAISCYGEVEKGTGEWRWQPGTTRVLAAYKESGSDAVRFEHNRGQSTSLDGTRKTCTFTAHGTEVELINGAWYGTPISRSVQWYAPTA